MIDLRRGSDESIPSANIQSSLRDATFRHAQPWVFTHGYNDTTATRSRTYYSKTISNARPLVPVRNLTFTV